MHSMHVLFDQEAARDSLAKTACSEAVDSVGLQFFFQQRPPVIRLGNMTKLLDCD